MQHLCSKEKPELASQQLAISWVVCVCMQELVAEGYFQCRIINYPVYHKIKHKYLFVTSSERNMGISVFYSCSNQSSRTQFKSMFGHCIKTEP